MKKMNARARIAALAAASSFVSALAVIPMAQAQPLFEFRTWSAPRYYEDAPRVYRQAPPRYIAREALPRRAVRRVVESQGYDVIGPIQLSGQVYLVPVEDMRGRVSRLVVDARDGEIIDRAGAGGPPRPPANVGRARDRYAAAPDASRRLPPLPLEPYGRFGGYEYGGPVPPPPASSRERLARGTPDGAYAPRGDEYDVEPGLGPVPPPPAPRATERARPNQQRPAARTQKPARQQQAARPPAAEKPAAAPAARAAAPSPSKPAESAEKPEARPETQAAVKPDATPDARPESAARPEAAPAPAAKREPMLPKASAPEARSEQARRAAEKRNASILRRPGSSKDVTRSIPQPRGSVAEAPTISTGAEPQRTSPRVVYPGPGAPAPEQAPTPAE